MIACDLCSYVLKFVFVTFQKKIKKNQLIICKKKKSLITNQQKFLVYRRFPPARLFQRKGGVGEWGEVGSVASHSMQQSTKR